MAPTKKEGNATLNEVTNDRDPSKWSGNHGMTEFLLEAAEVETRLRQHILELMEPTIRKQAVIELRFKELKSFSEKNRSEIDGLLAVRDGTESLNNIIDNFRSELASWDKQRHEHEYIVSDRLSTQEVEINALRQSLEMVKGVDNSSMVRSLQNLGDMLAQYKDENTDLRRFCVERLDLNRDKVAKLRDEFEMRTLAVENHLHRVQDSQTRLDTRIAHIDEVVSNMVGRVNNSCEGVADLWRAKASVSCLEEQQQDLEEFMRHTNATVASLKQQFGSLVDDVKSHFETATKVVGKSTAQQMEAIRGQYQQDLARLDRMATEMEDLVSKQKTFQETLQSAFESTRDTTESALEDLNSELDQLRQRGHIDQKTGQLEISRLKQSIAKLENCMHAEVGVVATPAIPSGNSCGTGVVATPAISNGVRSDTLAMLVENAFMGLACDLQDEEDRKDIALYAAKPMQPERTLISLPQISQNGRSQTLSPRRSRTLKTTTSSGGFGGSNPDSSFKEPVISLDSRCLSCSGSQATVLAGFKLACLQYRPGAVEYERKTYNRSDLIQKRCELLQQCRKTLEPRTIT
eukprot:CAMPEP_0169112086 /NCGR_PEP_ID=MMETSP1015-20121227/27439_1 /TAXON_ID=342587 /ORGANISM="Karlodinium micrum, Strain CCMP2283" /LENGTH=575 /DNA_ID=CAMNT_0009174083 /DNA_START=78 /DNA_END=1805 /DNA_ORIENTATION=-